MTDQESRNLAVIQNLYGAFGRGDIPAILGAMRDDVELEPGLDREVAPWIRPGRGKAAAQGFFEAIGTYLRFERFEPVGFLAGGDRVVVLLREDIVVATTGKRIHEDPGIHLWTLDPEGRVASIRHVVDTYQHHAAAT